MPYQGVTAFLISAFSITVVLTLLAIGLRHEKKEQAKNQDDHH